MNQSINTAFHHMLHMGAGSKRLSQIAPYYQNGWRESRLDVSSEYAPDIICDINDLSPIPSASYQSIYSAHNIEHVYAYQAKIVMKSMRRILANGGFAFIRTPNMQKVAKAFAENGPHAVLYHSPVGPITAHDTFYGKDSFLAKGTHYMAHKCGFSAQSLVDDLLAAGFARVFVQKINFELCALAFTHPLIGDEADLKLLNLRVGLPEWIDSYYQRIQAQV